MTTKWQNTTAENKTSIASLNFEKYTVQILYIVTVCTVVSFLGNTVVILIVYRNKKMRTTPNLLIVNMAVANILRPSLLLALWIILFSMRIADLSTAHKLLREIHLKLLVYVGEALHCTVMTSLTVVSVHRFYAVVFPLNAQLKSRKKCFVAIVFIWAFALTESSPIMFDLSDAQMDVYNTIYVVLILFFPCFVMFCLYSITIVKLWRQKIPGDPSTILIRKRRKQNITLTAMFINLLILFCLTNGATIIIALLFKTEIDPTNLAVITISLLLVYEVTNPFIFFIYCRSYRQGLKDLFSCC